MRDESDTTGLGERGNEEFVRLLLVYQKRIYGFILAMVPNYADAEDLFQQVVMVMCRRFSEFEPGSNFLAWGMQIARYQVLNSRKSSRRSCVQFSSETIDLLLEKTGDRLSRMDQRIVWLENCIKKLNSNEFELVRRRYEQGMRIKDIALETDEPVPQLYKMFNRIHLFLRRCVNAHLQEASEIA